LGTPVAAVAAAMAVVLLQPITWHFSGMRSTKQVPHLIISLAMYVYSNYHLEITIRRMQPALKLQHQQPMRLHYLLGASARNSAAAAAPAIALPFSLH
jgi:hypothetical protein